MLPVVFGWRSYPLALAVAVAIGLAISIASARYNRFPLKDFIRANTVLMVAALFGARLYAVVEAGTLPSSPRELFLPLLRLPGGLLGLASAGAVLFWAKGLRFAATMLDLASPAVGVSLAVLRVGCFLNGCCTGTLCELPWATRFPAPSLAWRTQVTAGLIPSQASFSLPVHPLSLYMGLASLGLGVILFFFVKRKQFDGQVFLLLIVGHGLTQGVLESWRFPYHGHLQAASVGTAMMGIAILAPYWYRRHTYTVD